MSMDVVAVDWSGKRSGAEESIWLALVRDGRLHTLENGRGREQVVARVIKMAGESERIVVGLDFAFSFPAWYLDAQGWETARDVWRAMGQEAESILESCPEPFWGRTGKRNLHGQEGARATERNRGFAPKSVFQIGGAGAVGTGSLRGMPCLERLAEAGFSIWPFDPPASRSVVEIYPRLLTEQVVKSRHRARLEYLSSRHGDQPKPLLERAAGSEDAFDAAVSAIVMSRHVAELEALEQAPAGAPERREGAIWVPRA